MAERNAFENKSIGEMISFHANNSWSIIIIISKFKPMFKQHVNTESPDLKMDFRSFDNGLNGYTDNYLCENCGWQVTLWNAADSDVA